MSEADLVQAVLELITLKGGVAIRINSGMRIIENADGSTRIFKGAAKGTADVLALYRGRFLAVECKVGKNPATEDQLRFLNDVYEKAGIAMIVRDGLEELERVLTLLDDPFYSGIGMSNGWKFGF